MLKPESWRATFQGMKMPIGRAPVGPFEVEVYNIEAKAGPKMVIRWRGRLLSTMQGWPERFKSAEDAMQATAMKFETCTAKWRKEAI